MGAKKMDAKRMIIITHAMDVKPTLFFF